MISDDFFPASSGAAAGAIIFLATYLPYFFMGYQYEDLSLATKVGWSLFHNVAMALGCAQLALFEARGTYYLRIKYNYKYIFIINIPFDNKRRFFKTSVN